MSSTEVVKKGSRVNKKDTNEYHFDLRQDVAWNLYTDQRSDTFNNAYRSAVKAGYSENTAKRISVEKWWINKIHILREMMPLVEKNIMEDLSIEKSEGKEMRKIRSEMTKFTASTVGRAKYHTKTEVESNSIISLVEGNSILDGLFKKK